jgi:hypothetical protein
MGEKKGAHAPGNGNNRGGNTKTWRGHGEVTEGAISHWMKSGRERGKEALKAHPEKGARPRLTAEQHAHIPAGLALLSPASGCGHQTGVWGERSS